MTSSVLQNRSSTTLLVVLVIAAPAFAQIRSIVKAPIVPDGTVAGATPDFVINLDISPDPSVDGRTFKVGEKVRITFPPAFVRNPDVTMQVEPANVFSSESCAPGNIQCTTGIMVQGWPQRPILPTFPTMPLGTGSPLYQVSMTGNVLELDVVQEITKEGPLPGPGVKAFHVILKDFTNPTQGTYDIPVEFVDANGSVTEEHVGQLEILDTIQRSINVTSILTESGLTNPNTIYQTTTPGERVPLPYDFYMWEKETGAPLTGVAIVPENDSFVLKSGDQTVGSVNVVTPPGGEDATIFSPEIFNEPITAFLVGAQAGRFRAIFQAGTAEGDYQAVFSMDDGNSVTMFTTVVPEPSTASLLLAALWSPLVIRRRRNRLPTGSPVAPAFTAEGSNGSIPARS